MMDTNLRHYLELTQFVNRINHSETKTVVGGKTKEQLDNFWFSFFNNADILFELNYTAYDIIKVGTIAFAKLHKSIEK